MGDMPDSGFPVGDSTPPHAAEELHAIDAFGATAPLDDTVARLSAAIPDLHGRLAASGFVVGQITARADTAPTEAGVPS